MSKATRSLRLDIPYPTRVLRQNGADGRDGQPETISLQLIVAAVEFRYTAQNRRMAIPVARIWERLQNAMLDDDGKARAGALTVSVEQFDWLYETITTNQYPPNFAGAIVTYLDYLEGLRALYGGKKPQPAEDAEESP